MKQELATQTKSSALSLMAGRFSVEPAKLLDTLKSTVFKGATNEELLSLVVVSNEYGLNPLLKEIYAFPAKGGGIVPVVSIDGWLRMMNDHPQFDGMDFEWEHEGEKLVSCTAVIHRKDRKHPIRVTEYLAECKRNTEPWKMEHRMLRHKATIQGARVAFGFSGIRDEEEAGDMARDVTPAKVPLFAASPALESPAKVETVPPAGETVRDAVKRKLAESGVTWEEMAREAEVNGIFASESAAIADTPEDVLVEMIDAWDILVAGVKGGAK